MSIYRKIYTDNFGPIPLDENGRTYDIHHIDGNHSNNSPSNLRAVSIQEHYDIHLAQEDWAACMLIGRRMKLPITEIRNLASLSQAKKVKEGTHPFLGGKVSSASNKTRVENGTHNFLGGQIQSVSNKRRVENGTHLFLDGELSRKVQVKRVKDGTHHFLIEKTCIHCGLVGKGPNMKRYHFDNCRKLN